MQARTRHRYDRQQRGRAGRPVARGRTPQATPSAATKGAPGPGPSAGQAPAPGGAEAYDTSGGAGHACHPVGPGDTTGAPAGSNEQRGSAGTQEPLPAPSNPGGPPGAAGPALVVGDSIALGSADSLRQALARAAPSMPRWAASSRRRRTSSGRGRRSTPGPSSSTSGRTEPSRRTTSLPSSRRQATGALSSSGYTYLDAGRTATTLFCARR